MLKAFTFARVKMSVFVKGEAGENDKSWLKHTMAWVNNNKKPKIRYRPVNLKTNSKEIKTIEPKVRVY